MIPDRTFSSCSSQSTLSPVVRPGLCCRRRREAPWNAPSQALSHHGPQPTPRSSAHSSGSRPANRQLPARLPRRTIHLLWTALLCVLFFVPVKATDQPYGFSDIFPTELLFDRSEPPTPQFPRMLLGRGQGDSPSTTTAITPTGSSAASGSLNTASAPLPANLPTPFDTTIGNNFTSSACPAFFNSFLNDKAFQDCLPFSLLLQTSSSFFAISKSLLRLTQTLDVSCNVDFNACSSLMDSLAQQIEQDGACGADLQMQNPVVIQAYNGLVAYPTLYHAGCLTDADGNYCFASAVTNSSSPSSSYVYYLPLGVQLPGGATPTCNSCLKQTMAIFAQTASNASQPLSTDYVSAAQQIQMNCGPTFVESVVAGSASQAGVTSTYSLACLVLLVSLATTIF